MSACKTCGKELGSGHWEKCTVLERDPKPADYFQVPSRVWLLQAGGVDVYMVGTALYCKPCYQKLGAAASA